MPFTHPAAVAAYANAFGLTPRVMTVESDGGIAAAMPILGKRRGPFHAAALPPLAPAWRPLLAAPLSEAATHRRSSPLDQLLRSLIGSVDQATLALAEDDLRPYMWAGWTATPRSTYRLDLRGDLAAGYSSATRRTVRKDAASFEITDDALAADAVRLMLASYRRQGADLGLDEAAVVQLAETFTDAGLARTFVAREGGEVRAAIVAAHDDRTAYYWIAGSVPGAAMTVLLDHALRQLAESGIETFDFCGANTPSIAEFKRRFGPSLAPAPIVRIVAHPVLRVVDRLRG